LSRPRLAPGGTVFLDRDGTINVSPPEGEYVTSPQEIRLLPGAGKAIALLNRHPARVVVVTNQRGIALGRMGEDDLRAVNERLEAKLASEGARLDAILHCPHHEGACDCRKPRTGMLERAAREVEGVSLAGAAMVGDSERDVGAGRRLGLTTVRLAERREADDDADHVAPSLLAAVRWLLDGESPTGSG
jgi:D-glycero-D-manno-heptose 1,7-bisphosphate phosphatase